MFDESHRPPKLVARKTMVTPTLIVDSPFRLQLNGFRYSHFNLSFSIPFSTGTLYVVA